MPNETVAVPTTPEGVLCRAAEVIEQVGWGRGDFVNPAGEVCLLGGCLAALDLPLAVENEDEAPSLFWAAALALAEYLDADRYLPPGPDLIGAVGEWNDECCLDQTQAVSVLRAAAGGCKEAGGG